MALPRAVGQQAGLGLVSVWCALLAFYGTRLLGHLARYCAFGGGAFRGAASDTPGSGSGEPGSKGRAGDAAL